MIVSEVTTYEAEWRGMKIPRVKITIEGYRIIIGDDRNGNLHVVAEDVGIHPKIKQRAYAIAAVRLRAMRKPAPMRPMISFKEEFGKIIGKVPFGRSLLDFSGVWFGPSRILVEFPKCEYPGEAGFDVTPDQKLVYLGYRSFRADGKKLPRAERVARKVAEIMLKEKVSGQFRLF